MTTSKTSRSMSPIDRTQSRTGSHSPGCRDTGAIPILRVQRTGHVPKPLRLYALVLSVCLAGIGSVSAGQPLFDAHLHYNTEDAAQFPPDRIVAMLRASDVSKAVVTGRPPRQVMLLHERAPSLILPILGVYRTQAEKETWMNDAGLPARVEKLLASGAWRGVGELHIFAKDRRSPVFLRIADLAVAHSLPLLMHCDPAVIDSIFEHAPEATVVWAHAGAYPYPPLLRDYLGRYPNLYIDLSVRDERVAPSGAIDPDWELLLTEFSDRFLVGVDTYRTERWGNYPAVVKTIRGWLEQLPEEVAEAIGYRNGERLYARKLGE